MAYRKITILVDCTTDNEKQVVQQMADELSNMRIFDGKQLVSIYPMFKEHKSDFIQMFKLATGPQGPMGLLSVEGARLLSKFTKLIRK